MKVVFSVLIFMCFIFSGCRDLLDNTDNYVEALSFQAGSFTVYEGSMEVCNLYASPTDSFSYYVPVYAVEDTSICCVKTAEINSVVISALKEGSTLLVAQLGNRRCYAVINVKSNSI